MYVLSQKNYQTALQNWNTYMYFVHIVTCYEIMATQCKQVACKSLNVKNPMSTVSLQAPFGQNKQRSLNHSTDQLIN